jgi:hypothetical protein
MLSVEGLIYGSRKRRGTAEQQAASLRRDQPGPLDAHRRARKKLFAAAAARNGHHGLAHCTASLWDITRNTLPHDSMTMLIDAEAELKLLENSMRDAIRLVLERKFGSNWEVHLKVTENRIAQWKARLEAEEKRLAGRALDSRLLYYSDFYDLKEIVKKHWDDGFKDVFSDLRMVEVFMEQMEKLRDPNAHRRELSSHQKCLIVGVSGELRIRIMQFRGKGENVDDYFPVIESARDNLGNSYPLSHSGNVVVAQQVLRVGDTIEFYVTSTDPNGGALEYTFTRNGGGPDEWSKLNYKSITLTEAAISKACDFGIKIRSDKGYTALPAGYDDIVWFRYTVLPAQK